MTEHPTPPTRPGRRSFSVVGLGAAACVACCIGPIVAFLGGVTVLGVAGTWFAGWVSLAIAALAGGGGYVVLRRRRTACATPTPVAMPTPKRKVSA